MGEIRLCISGKMAEKNLRRGITQGQGYLEMMEKWVETKKDIEWKASCSRYYWSVGSGARKPMGFLGPAHDESWSAGWHIILLIKAWMER